jgi:DNA-binding NarL/FixJ family response regulator
MHPHLDRIVFVTEQPLRIAALRELLFHAGLTAEESVLLPGALASNLKSDESSLVILDGEFQQPWETIVLARLRAVNARFVWLPMEITPRVIHAALEAGLHGVLSNNLPFDETIQALQRIWQGECQFRYGHESAPKARTGLKPPPAISAWTKAPAKHATAGSASW